MLGEGVKEVCGKNMAQNQQSDKPTFSEVKMLYQIINMKTQFSGNFHFQVQNSTLANTKIIQQLT
jgi:hypothetical protein